MGADYPDDHLAIAEIKKLPSWALEWIHHHFGNALTGVIGGIEIKDYKLAKQAAEHAIADLKKIRGRGQVNR